MTLREYLKSIANTIRHHLSMSEDEKINAQDFTSHIDTVAEANWESGYNSGYERGHDEGGEYHYSEGYNSGLNNGLMEGKQAEYDAFWDAYQYNHGAAQKYEYTFSNFGWNDETFKPKYDIIMDAGYSGTSAFLDCKVSNIAEALEKQGVRLDTTLCGYASSMFQNTKTKRLPELNLTHTMDYNEDYGLYMTFRDSLVETIDKLIVAENLKYNYTFQFCTKLKNIVFEGVIGQAINFQWSTLLSHDSIVSVINALSTTASGQTATFSKTAVNNAFTGGSTGSEWQTLIATKPNWTISLV